MDTDSLKVATILLDSRFGGPQNCTLEVARALRTTDIEMLVVIAAQDSGPLHEKMQQGGVDVARLGLHRPSLRIRNLIAGMAAFLPETVKLARFLRRRQVAVVTAIGVAQVESILAGRLAGARVLLELHDAMTTPLYHRLFTLASPLCDGFIVVSQRTKEIYFSGINARQARKPVFEIPVPVDIGRFNPTEVEAAADLANCDGISVTTVCNINPDKGLEHFVEMARLLEARYSSLRFNIVGLEHETQRSYAAGLRRVAKKAGVRNLQFIGARYNVPAVLKATDIYVCSSVSEASPTSVWEAMAMERAIVSTQVGDVARYITDGENGFIVPVADGAALAKKVGVLIENEHMRRSFGPKARAAVVPLDIAACAAKRRAAYRQIAGLN